MRQLEEQDPPHRPCLFVIVFCFFSCRAVHRDLVAVVVVVGEEEWDHLFKLSTWTNPSPPVHLNHDHVLPVNK